MKNFRDNHQRCSIKTLFLKISQNSQKTPVLKSLCDNIVDLPACSFIIYSRSFPVNIAKFWNFLQNTYFEEHLQTTASGFFKCFPSLHLLV